jgi:DNA integrity scanning protein DisA with diadenylate cyclase activity
MKLYRAKRKAAEEAANPKPVVDAPQKSVVIPVIKTNTKTNMRQPKGLKYKVNKVVDTVPSYVTRDTKLEPTTIDN